MEVSLFLIPDGDQVTLFVHLPKAGGSSIRKDRQLNQSAAFYDPPADWEYSHSFTIVRDPYERFLSAYLDFKYNRGMVPDGMSQRQWLDFHIDNDIDNPGSAGHHISSIFHPIHGFKYAKKIFLFDQYPFDRHERPSPPLEELDDSAREGVSTYLERDVYYYKSLLGS